MSQLLCSCAGRRRRRDRRRASSSSSRTPTQTPTPRAQRRRAFPRDDVLRVPPGVELYRAPVLPSAPLIAPPTAPLPPSAPEPPSSRSSSSTDCSLPMVSREKLADSRETLPVGGDTAGTSSATKTADVDVCCKGSGDVWVKMDPSSASFPRRKTPNKQVAASVDRVWTKEGARRRLYGSGGAWSTEDFTNTQIGEGDDIWVKVRPQNQQAHQSSDVKNMECAAAEEMTEAGCSSKLDSVPSSSSEFMKAKSVTLDRGASSKLKSDAKEESNSFLNWFWTLFRSKGKETKKENTTSVQISTPSKDAIAGHSASITARENGKVLGEAARAVLTGSDFRLIDDDNEGGVYDNACDLKVRDSDFERRGSTAASEAVAKRLEDIDEVLKAVYERNVAYGRSVSMQRLTVPASRGDQSEGVDNFISRGGDIRSVSCHSLVKSTEKTPPIVEEVEDYQRSHEKKISVGSSSPSSYYSHSRSESELTNDEEFLALGMVPPPAKGKPSQTGYLRLSEPSFTDAECAHYKVDRYLEQSDDAQWFGHSDQSLEGRTGKQLEPQGAVPKQDIKSDVEERVFQMAANFDEGVRAIRHDIEKCLTPPSHIPGAEETASFLVAERNWQKAPITADPPKVTVTEGDYNDRSLLGFTEEGLDDILAMPAESDVGADEWAGFDPVAWSREKGLDPAAVGTKLKYTSPPEKWLHEVKQGEVLGTPSHEAWSDIQRALQELVDSQDSALLEELKTFPETQAQIEPLLKEPLNSQDDLKSFKGKELGNEGGQSHFTTQTHDSGEAENVPLLKHVLNETVSEIESGIAVLDSGHFESKQSTPNPEAHFVLEQHLENQFQTAGNEVQSPPEEVKKSSGNQIINLLDVKIPFIHEVLPQEQLPIAKDSLISSEKTQPLSSVNVFTLSEETLNNLRSAAQNIEESAGQDLISIDEQLTVDGFKTQSVSSSSEHSPRNLQYSEGECVLNSPTAEEYTEPYPIQDIETSEKHIDHGSLVMDVRGIIAQSVELSQDLETERNGKFSSEWSKMTNTASCESVEKHEPYISADEKTKQLVSIPNIKAEATLPEMKFTKTSQELISPVTNTFQDLSIVDNKGIISDTKKILTEKDGEITKYNWPQHNEESQSPPENQQHYFSGWTSPPLSAKDKVGQSNDPFCDRIWTPSDTEISNAATNMVSEHDLIPSLQENITSAANPGFTYCTPSKETVESFEPENIGATKMFGCDTSSSKMHRGRNFHDSEDFIKQDAESWFSAGSEVWDPFNMQTDSGVGRTQEISLNECSTEAPWLSVDSSSKSLDWHATTSNLQISTDTPSPYHLGNIQLKMESNETENSTGPPIYPQKEDSWAGSSDVKTRKRKEMRGDSIPSLLPNSPIEASECLKTSEKEQDPSQTDERGNFSASFEDVSDLKQCTLHAVGSKVIQNPCGPSDPFGEWEFVGFREDELNNSDSWKLNMYSDFSTSDLACPPAIEFGKDFTIINMPAEDNFEEDSFASHMGRPSSCETAEILKIQPENKIWPNKSPENKSACVLPDSHSTMSQLSETLVENISEHVCEENRKEPSSDFTSNIGNTQQTVVQQTPTSSDNRENSKIDKTAGERYVDDSYLESIEKTTSECKTEAVCDKTSEKTLPTQEKPSETKIHSDVRKTQATKELEYINSGNSTSTVSFAALQTESISPPFSDSSPFLAESVNKIVDSDIQTTELAINSPKLDNKPSEPSTTTAETGLAVIGSSNTVKAASDLVAGTVEEHASRKRQWSGDGQQFSSFKKSDATERTTKRIQQVFAAETSRDSFVELDSYSEDSVFLDDEEAAPILGQGGYILHPISKQLIRRSASLSSEPLSPMTDSSDMSDNKKSTGEDSAEDKGDEVSIDMESIAQQAGMKQSVEVKPSQTERKGSVVIEKITAFKNQISEGIQHRKDSVYSTEKKLLEKMHSWLVPVEKSSVNLPGKIIEEDVIAEESEEQVTKTVANSSEMEADKDEISADSSGELGITEKPGSISKVNQTCLPSEQLICKLDVSCRENSNVLHSEKREEKLSDAPKVTHIPSQEREIKSESPTSKDSPESRTTLADIHWNPPEGSVADLPGLEYETVIVDRDPLLGKEFTIVLKSSSDTENCSSEGSGSARRPKRMQSPCFGVGVTASRLSEDLNNRHPSGQVDSEVGSHRSTDYSSSPVGSEDEYFLEDIPHQALEYATHAPNPLIYEECDSDEADVECGDSSRPATSSSDDWYFSSSRAVDVGLALSYGPPSNASSRLDLQPVIEQDVSDHERPHGSSVTEASQPNRSTDHMEVFTEQHRSGDISPGERSSVSCEGPDYYDIEMRIDNVLKRIDALQESDTSFCATEYVGDANPFDFTKDEWMCLEANYPLEGPAELEEEPIVEGCGSTVEEDQRFLEETYLNTGGKSKLQRVCTRQNLTKNEHLETNPFVSEAERNATTSSSASISGSDQHLISDSSSNNPFFNIPVTFHGRTTGTSNPFLYTEAEIRDQLRRAGFSSEEEIFPISPPGGTVSEASSGVAGDRSCSPDSSSTDSSEGTLVQDTIATLPMPNEELLLSPRNLDKSTLSLRKQEINLEANPKMKGHFSETMHHQAENMLRILTGDTPKILDAVEGQIKVGVEKYEPQTEIENISCCSSQPEFQSNQERSNERPVSLPDLIAKDLELTEPSVSIVAPNTPTDTTNSDHSRTFRSPIVINNQGVVKQDVGSGVAAGRACESSTRDEPVLRLQPISSCIPLCALDEQRGIGHSASAIYQDLQSECVSADIGTRSPPQEASLSARASSGVDAGEETVTRSSVLPDLVGPTGGSGDIDGSPQAKRRQAATNETTFDGHQEMLGALDLAQNSNVQDAFVIAVEQQARERLERLSALRKIKPVDMNTLSKQLNRQSAAQAATDQPQSQTQPQQQLNGFIEGSPIYVTSLTTQQQRPPADSAAAKAGSGELSNGHAPQPAHSQSEDSGDTLELKQDLSDDQDSLPGAGGTTTITHAIVEAVAHEQLLDNNAGSRHRESSELSSKKAALGSADDLLEQQQQPALELEAMDDGVPHREMAVDVPDSFVGRTKTPPRYPPPRPRAQQGGAPNGATPGGYSTPASPPKPVPPPRDHLRIEQDGRLVNRATPPQLPARSPLAAAPAPSVAPDAAAAATPTRQQLDSIRKYQEQLRKRKEAEEQQEALNRSLRGSRKLQALESRPHGLVNDAYSSADDEDAEDPAQQLANVHRIIRYEELVASLQRLQTLLKKNEGAQVAAVQTLLLSPQFGRALAVHNRVQKAAARGLGRPPAAENAHALSRDCLEQLRPCKLPEAAELCDLLSRYEVDALLQAHDAVVATAELQTPAPSPTPSPTRGHGTGSVTPPARLDGNIRIVRIEKTNEPLGATVRNEGEAVIIGRIVRGGAAEKSGLLREGDEILEVNGIEMRGKSVNEVCDILAGMTGTLSFLVVGSSSHPPPPSRETTIIHMKAHFDYDPEDDLYIPCRELGISFQKGDVLHVISQDDPNWWQAYREGEEDLTLAGLIPSKSFQHQRETMKQTIAGDRLTKEGKSKKASTLLCAKKNPKKKKKKPYNASYTDGGYPLYTSAVDDYESDEILTYEEVALYYPRATHRRPVVLIGPPNIGRHELRQRLMEDSERFAAAVPHTSRPRKEGEVDGQDYHFISRAQFEADILARRFVEHGEYERAYYGTSLAAIRAVVDAGRTCVLNLHPQSLRILRASDLKPYVVFVAPPSLEKLRQKKARAGEAYKEEELKDIIEKAREMEDKYGHLFDLIIINNDTDRAFQQLLSEINSLEREPQWVPAAWVKAS